jgi:hypothetical protein
LVSDKRFDRAVTGFLLVVLIKIGAYPAFFVFIQPVISVW